MVLVGVAYLSLGDDHSMVLKLDGSAWFTGANDLGQLGDGTSADKNRFTKVISSGVAAVAAGFEHSMVLKQDGSVWATGRNAEGL